MASISFGGLATGIDTNAIIQQLLILEARPLQRLENDRLALVNKQAGLSSFEDRLETLADRFKELKESDELALFTGSSSDEDVVSVSAQGAAIPGRFTLNVTDLAKSESNAYLSPFADKDTTTFSGGSVDITVDGNTETITVDNTDTLEDLRDKINDSDAGVRASIINDGSGYQLVVSSEKTGVANAFSLTSTGFSGDDPFASVTSLTTAQDASFTIDGLAITSASNSVSDAVEGVTFDLVAAGTAEVDVDYDKSGIADKLDEVVNAYNDIMSFLDGQDSQDVAFRSIRSRLRGVVADGLDQNDFSLFSLSQLGIETDASGRLSLDRSKLDSRIDEDFDAVLELFSGKSDGSADGVAQAFDLLFHGDKTAASTDPASAGILSPGNGLLQATRDSLASRIRDYENRITREEERLDRTETNLTRRFAAYESLTSQYQAQGSFLAAAASGF